MYIPSHFHFQDNAEKIAFMKRYSFATIVTVKDNLPIATHLPFFIDDRSDKLLLSSHFAKANEQHKYIEDNISLVIFSELHAYISPSNYDKRESVPPWDYIAIHAYGKAKILEDETNKAAVLEQMIRFYEEDYMQQRESLNDKFKKGMMKCIVAFEIEITDLQGQKKIEPKQNGNRKTSYSRKFIQKHKYGGKGHCRLH
jgi:transcriptional regulator